MIVRLERNDELINHNAFSTNRSYPLTFTSPQKFQNLRKFQKKQRQKIVLEDKVAAFETEKNAGNADADEEKLELEERLQEMEENSVF